jgi:hypothetical protein
VAERWKKKTFRRPSPTSSSGPWGRGQRCAVELSIKFAREFLLNWKCVGHSSATNVRRKSNRVGASPIQVWRTLHDFCLYPPFHVLTTQDLQPTHYFARVEYWPLAFEQPEAPRENFIHRRDHVQQKGKEKHGIHVSGHSLVLTRTQGYIFEAVFRLALGAMLLEVKSSGRLHLKSAWHPSTSPVSWKMSSQCCYMFLSTSDKRCVITRWRIASFWYAGNRIS